MCWARFFSTSPGVAEICAAISFIRVSCPFVDAGLCCTNIVTLESVRCFRLIASQVLLALRARSRGKARSYRLGTCNPTFTRSSATMVLNQVTLAFSANNRRANAWYSCMLATVSTSTKSTSPVT